MSKVQSAQNMLTWLVQEGGYVHPSVVVRDDPSSGLGIYTTTHISEDERLISCPFSLAITPALATSAIVSVTGVAESDLVYNGKPWSERMLAAAYVGLHWIYSDKKDTTWPDALAHRPYVDALPPVAEMTTPHYFTAQEKELLKGTNLAGAVEAQEREWHAESDAVRSVLKEDGLTQDRYLAVATYLSSRAFPSALLRLPDGETSTAEASEESHPVLLPGLDMLNHARGHPILWLSSRIPRANADPVPAISFVAPVTQEPGQLYNNYGAKSNESLLLGYGFVIPSNPNDTVVLQLGGVPDSLAAVLEKKGLDATRRFEVGRDGEMPLDLVRTLRVMMADSGCACCGDHEEHPAHGEDDGHAHGHDHGHSHGPDDNEEDEEEDEHAAHEKEVAEFELELDVLGMLGGMLEDKLSRLESPELEEGEEGVREEVRDMVETYRRGQIDILNSALDKLGERVDRVEGLLAEGPECPCGC